MLDLHSECTWFGFWLGHQLPWANAWIVTWLGHYHFHPNSFQFIRHPTICCYIVQILLHLGRAQLCYPWKQTDCTVHLSLLLKLVLRKLTFSIWAPITFMKILLMAILFKDTVPINYWNLINIIRSVFEENHYFVLWGPPEARKFVFTGHQPTMAKFLKMNENKICPTVQALEGCKTDICYDNNQFFIFWEGLKMRKSLEISRSDFFHIYTKYMKEVKKELLRVGRLKCHHSHHPRVLSGGSA
jgi:hypothetical protein